MATATYEELVRPERHTARFPCGFPKGLRFVGFHRDAVKGALVAEVETVMGIRCFLVARGGRDYKLWGRMFGSLRELQEAL